MFNVFNRSKTKCEKKAQLKQKLNVFFFVIFFLCVFNNLHKIEIIIWVKVTTRMIFFFGMVIEYENIL